MAKKKPSEAITVAGPVYLVQEKVYEEIPEEYLEFMDEFDDEDIPAMSLADGWAPMKAFADRAAAEAFCTEHENKRRTKISPFARGTELSDWSNLDGPRFHDWLLDAGLEPPKKKKLRAQDWREWWEKNHKKMTALQRAKVWEALDKVRYYMVVELKE